jgi:hypothetical protein
VVALDKVFDQQPCASELDQLGPEKQTPRTAAMLELSLSSCLLARP